MLQVMKKTALIITLGSGLLAGCAGGKNEAATSAQKLPVAVPARHDVAYVKTSVGFVRDADGSGAVAPPLVAFGKVFFLNGEGVLYALQPNGTLIYSVDLKPEGLEKRGGRGGGLAAGADALYVTTGFGQVLRLDPTDGRVQTRVDLERPVRAAPSVGPQAVVVRSIDDRLSVLDLNSLAVRDVRRSPPIYGAVYPYAAPVLVRDGAVLPLSTAEAAVFGNFPGGREGTRFNLRSGGSLPGGGVPDATVQTPAVEGSVAYITSDGGMTLAVDLRSGRKVWSSPYGATASPLLAGGKVWLVNRGIIRALNQGDGQVVLQKALPDNGVPAGIAAVGNRLAVAVPGRVLWLTQEGIVQSYTDGPDDPLPPASVQNKLYVAGNGRLWTYNF